MDRRAAIIKLLKRADSWLLIGFGVMAVAFFSQTFNYRPSAALFPRLTSIVVALFCAYQLMENGWNAWKGKAPSKPREEQETAALAWHWVALTLVGYLVLIYLIGFYPATLVYMLVFPPLVGYRRWTIIVPTAVVLTAVVALSFGSILHIQMPEAWITTVCWQGLWGQQCG